MVISTRHLRNTKLEVCGGKEGIAQPVGRTRDPCTVAPSGPQDAVLPTGAGSPATGESSANAFQYKQKERAWGVVERGTQTLPVSGGGDVHRAWDRNEARILAASGEGEGLLDARFAGFSSQALSKTGAPGADAACDPGV